jgi:glyoxylase-like metal-dependent hydrolase (beta-lactamase superfamily II)
LPELLTLFGRISKLASTANQDRSKVFRPLFTHGVAVAAMTWVAKIPRNAAAKLRNVQQEINMRLENASQLRRSEVEESVPSRYALRIGEIDVLVVSDGVLPLPTKMLAHNADPTDRAAWLKDMFLPPDAFDWPLNAVLVRSAGQTILIDAGLGADPNLALPRAGQLGQRLEAAGIDLTSVTDVVLTHMHMDHVGGLLVDGVKDRLRPDLRIHLAAAEVKFWESPDFSRTAMPQGFPDALWATAKRFMAEYSGHLRPFEDEHEVAPGVVVCRTGGHTPGHSVVRVASARDRLMFAGDALFPVGFEHPDWHNGFEHDPEEAARVRVRLLQELATTGGLLVATHMPFPSLGRVAPVGEVFRWVPTFWDY